MAQGIDGGLPQRPVASVAESVVHLECERTVAGVNSLGAITAGEALTALQPSEEEGTNSSLWSMRGTVSAGARQVSPVKVVGAAGHG